MSVVIKKVKSGYRVATPSGVKAKHTTLAKAKAQRRLLQAVDHGWNPTTESLMYETTFGPGQLTTVFVPAYFSAALSQDFFAYGCRDALKKLAERSYDNSIVDEVEELVRDKRREEIENDDAEAALDTLDRLNGDVDDEVDEEAFDEGLDEYVRNNFGHGGGGRGSAWDKFLQSFGTDHDPIENAEDFGVDPEAALMAAAEDWNEAKMAQYADDPLLLKLGVKSMTARPGKHGKNLGLFIDVLTDASFMDETGVNKEAGEVLVNWITGQMSDGWGEGFEQHGEKEGDYEISIHFYKGSHGFGKELPIVITGAKPAPSNFKVGLQQFGTKAKQQFATAKTAMSNRLKTMPAPVQRVANAGGEALRRGKKAYRALRGEGLEKHVDQLVAHLLDG